MSKKYQPNMKNPFTQYFQKLQWNFICGKFK